MRLATPGAALRADVGREAPGCSGAAGTPEDGEQEEREGAEQEQPDRADSQATAYPRPGDRKITRSVSATDVVSGRESLASPGASALG